MKISGIRNMLIDLVATSGRADLARLKDLDAADWTQLDALARMHRLQPLLHWLHRDNGTVPREIAATWQDAYRHAAMLALIQKAELGETAALLRGKGFEPVALKGAHLAWHAYPEPALRPLRDIDLILPAGDVVPAYEELRAAGYRLADALTMPIEDYLRFDKHLPLMIAPRGTPVELHKRLSQPEGRLDLDAPDVDEAMLMDRSTEIDSVAYPVPEDMLAHLVVHAVFGHRLDCGPLVLTDILYLARSHELDWTAFWKRARSQGWHHGARLLIELVRSNHGDDAVQKVPDEPDAPPDHVISTARQLLLQSLETRRSAKVYGALTSGNVARLRERMAGKVTADGQAPVVQDRGASGGRLRWALNETFTALRHMADGNVRAQSRDLAKFRRWLEG